MKNKEKIEENIEILGLETIENYFGLDLKKIDPKLLKEIHNQARLGMTFHRERNVSKRAIENNYIRIIKLISKDKKEIRQLIRKGLPNYV